MKFEHGLELIKQIGLERQKILQATRDYEEAEANILEINKPSVMNQTYERIKVEQSEIIETSRAKANDCYQELMDLKNDISLENWHTLLEYLGFTLAKYDHNRHVDDSSDLEELKTIISHTIIIINRKIKRREQAIAKKDEDRIVILSAEIAFYENDLKKHPLGLEALEKVLDKEKKEQSHDRKK